MVKKLKKVLSLVVCSTFILSISSFAYAKDEGKEITTKSIQDFKLGISCADANYLQQGTAGWTTFVRNGQSDTGWVSDSNGADPDYFKLSFVQGVNLLNDNLDFRIGVQLSDNGAGQNTGEIRYTPWASEGGGWSAYAADSNKYDPDYIKIIVETRTTDGYRASNVRFGIQACDNGDTGKNAGTAKYTPWVNDEYKGDTGWASDSNNYDPDAVRVCLDIVG